MFVFSIRPAGAKPGFSTGTMVMTVDKTSGKFDTLTYNAVIDFQKKTGMGADGIVGSQTMEKLLTV